MVEEVRGEIFVAGEVSEGGDAAKPDVEALIKGGLESFGRVCEGVEDGRF